VKDVLAAAAQAVAIPPANREIFDPLICPHGRRTLPTDARCRNFHELCDGFVAALSG